LSAAPNGADKTVPEEFEKNTQKLKSMSLPVPTWQETVAGGLWLAGASGLIWLESQLPTLESTILWIILLVGLVIVLRRFWAWLLGPLFFYDLVRTARRNRPIPARCCFAIAMLAVIFLFYVNWFNLRLNSWDELFSPPAVRLDSLAAFGSSMFSFFFGMQYLAVFLLTPIYTAGAITEEKERRTLDLLLTTQLTNREIVVGLLASRLATLGLIFLTTLPILSLLEFLGGVDPKFVLAGFLMTSVAMVLIGCMNMMTSVNAKTSKGAFALGYIYPFILGGCWCWAPMVAAQSLGSFSGTYVMVEFIAIMALILSAVVLVRAVVRLRTATQGANPWPMPPGVLRHGGEVPVYGALMGLRDIYPVHESALEVNWPRPRRRVTDPPVFWKETSYSKINSELPINLIGFLVILVLLCGILRFNRGQDDLMRLFAPWLIPCLVFPVGFIASRMIAKEREAGTLETLLTTSLEPKEILTDKRNASIFRIRLPFLFFLGFSVSAVLGNAIQALASFCLIAALAVYLAFFACLGLLISTQCRTKIKATLVFIVVFVLFGIGDGFDFVSISREPHFTRWMGRILFYSLSPLSAVQQLAFNEESALENFDEITAAIASLGFLALVTCGVWRLTIYCFERSTGGRAKYRPAPPIA
jgi:ABC-type transport system involved in multi-copper enzyme maturation permease subunit